MDRANVVIIGGGVVGCALACEIAAHTEDVFLLEQMPKLGMATSTRNSGVVHSGIYYPPGSLKAPAVRFRQRHDQGVLRRARRAAQQLRQAGGSLARIRNPRAGKAGGQRPRQRRRRPAHGGSRAHSRTRAAHRRRGRARGAFDWHRRGRSAGESLRTHRRRSRREHPEPRARRRAEALRRLHCRGHRNRRPGRPRFAAARNHRGPLRGQRRRALRRRSRGHAGQHRATASIPCAANMPR